MVRIRRRIEICDGCMYLTRNTSSSYYCECDGTDGKLRQAVPIIFVGVCIAGFLVAGITYGVIHLF